VLQLAFFGHHIAARAVEALLRALALALQLSKTSRRVRHSYLGAREHRRFFLYALFHTTELMIERCKRDVRGRVRLQGMN
jgi:hypothetical protein